jgi:hypothetical protein
LHFSFVCSRYYEIFIFSDQVSSAVVAAHRITQFQLTQFFPYRKKKLSHCFEHTLLLPVLMANELCVRGEKKKNVSQLQRRKIIAKE